MAKTDVWMPLFIGDYMADTMHLTTEQHGAYLLLIMSYWRKGGPLPADDIALSSICRLSIDAWSIARAVLVQFFDVSSSNAWVHHRIEKELLSASQKQSKAAEKAKKAAEARWNNAPSIAQALLKECPSPSPSDKPKHKYLPDDLAIAWLIAEKVLLITKSTKPPNLESWANSIRMMREIDNRPPELIRSVFLWANADSFWKSNILSAPTLREKFDKLFAKMNSEATNGQTGNGSAGHQRPDNSAVGRVRANAERERIKLAGSGSDFNHSAMGADDRDVRPQMDEPIRGRDRSEQCLGGILEGDYARDG